METVKVSFERYVMQVHNGSHYNGYVIIEDVKFDYELVFEIPIANLNNVNWSNKKKEVQQLFQLAVRRDNSNIELTREEYDFFFSITLELALGVYNITQTRGYYENMICRAVSGASVSISMTRNGLLHLSQKICEMLRDPKFGCKIA